MQPSRLLCQRACKASTAALASSRPVALRAKISFQPLPCNTSTNLPLPALNSGVVSRCVQSLNSNCCRIYSRNPPSTTSLTIRSFSTTPTDREAKVSNPIERPEVVEVKAQNVQHAKEANGDETKEVEQENKEQEQKKEEREFERPEKADLVTQLDLSARLSAGRTSGKWGGFREVWRLLSIAKGETKILTLAFAFLIVSSGISISIPFSIGKILDLAAAPDGEKEQLFGIDLTTFYIGLGTLLVVGAGATYGRIITLRIVGERIVTKLRSQLFRQTYAQNAEFFDANRTGDLISRLGSDTIIVGKSITQNLSDGLRSVVSGGAGIAAMAYVSFKLTAVLAIIGPPVAIGSVLYGRIVRNISRKIQENLGTLTKIAEERIGNVKTSQAFAGEILEVARYNKQTKKIFKLGVREGLYSAAYYGGNTMAGNLTILAMLYIGGNMVKTGEISIGELTSFLMYTAYAGGSLVGLSNFYSELMKGVGAATRLFEMQDRKPTISPTVGVQVKSARGPIRFENVSFSYPTRPGVNIFKDLDFEIPQGSNVAIVGPSGGGKSTISSLLLRFYLPTQGAIKIDGVDVTTMNIKSLRRRIGIVAQEPVLFSGTIAENIAYGKPHATRTEIIAAARQANCQQFIGSLPDGLETSVGARGTQLSGGQKQRIAIARALIKNPDILILDEATSALDAESETLVNSALSGLLKGNNTTISIAHRLSTIKRSDTIIVLSADGQVAEQGSYKELSTNPKGAFTKLMEWQMSGGEVIADKMDASTLPSPPASTEESESEDDLPDESGDEDARREASVPIAASADQAGNK